MNLIYFSLKTNLGTYMRWPIFLNLDLFFLAFSFQHVGPQMRHRWAFPSAPKDPLWHNPWLCVVGIIIYNPKALIFFSLSGFYRLWDYIIMDQIEKRASTHLTIYYLGGGLSGKNKWRAVREIKPIGISLLPLCHLKDACWRTFTS
jgi:hypothetical protein